MAHVAFFAAPGAGHVYPTLGIVAELVARGHRVSYASTADYSASVTGAGADFVGYETTMRAVFAGLPQFTGRDLVEVMHASLRETQAVLPVVRAAFDGDEPDVVVCDAAAPAWPGRLLAARWGVPAVQFWPNFAGNEHWSMARTYMRVNPLSRRMLTFLLGLHRLVARHGAGLTVRDLTRGGSVRANLVLLPRAFQVAGETFDSSFRFVGPCLGGRAFQGTWKRDRPERDLVLVSLGTGYNRRPEFFRACAEAFADPRWDVVMSIGGAVNPADLGELPPHIQVHRSVPQLEVLRDARLFVTHAGMGSVMEALDAGVPMLAVPQMAEQRANADRLVQLGLGRALDPDLVTAAAVRAAAEAVVDDPDVRTGVGRMQREIRSAGGAGAAADVIESAVRPPSSAPAEQIGDTP